MKKILVTYRIPEEGLLELRRHFDVTLPEGRMSFTREEVFNIISEYDGLLAAGVKVDKEFLDAAAKLKMVSNYGAGYDNIDTGYAAQKGVVVTNIPDAVTESTAELAFGLMLDVMRRISECDRGLRKDPGFKWGMMNHMGHNLYGKTVGIIGMGRIGRSFARRAAAFSMNILYYNRNRLPEHMEKSVGAQYCSLEDLLKRSDVVSINTPLTPETRHILGRKELELMKSTAYIVNTARGAVIDEQVLVEMLQSGRLAGAGLDVFEREPIIPQELLTMDHVVLTPHIGTEAVEVRIQMVEDACRRIIDFFQGKRPENVVNPEVYDRA